MAGDDASVQVACAHADGSHRRRLSVALLDDHEVVLDGLKRVLERKDMQVVGSFRESAPALDFLASHEIDLLVVDLRLKTGSAVELVEHAHGARPRMPIAVLTSFEDRPAAAAAVRSGATGFLLKDASADEISQRLRSVAEGNLVIDQRLANAVLQPTTPVELSDSEQAILAQVAEGRTNREIASAMCLSPYTVKDYLARSMRTLGTSTRTETVMRAMRQGLLQHDPKNA